MAVDHVQRGASSGMTVGLALSGGGPVPPTLRAAWLIELLLPLVECCGQAELGAFVALGFPQYDHDGETTRRIGPELPDKEVRIVWLDGARLPIGSVGEIILSGGCMAGY